MVKTPYTRTTEGIRRVPSQPLLQALCTDFWLWLRCIHRDFRRLCWLRCLPTMPSSPLSRPTYDLLPKASNRPSPTKVLLKVATEQFVVVKSQCDIIGAVWHCLGLKQLVLPWTLVYMQLCQVHCDDRCFHIANFSAWAKLATSVLPEMDKRLA